MKHLSIILAALISLLACSCSSNTPSSVAEKALSALTKKDCKTVASLMCNAKGEALTPEQQEQYASLLQQKSQALPENYKITEETIDESGDKAVVKYETTDDNGKTQENSINLIKGKDGKWRISTGK